MHCRNAKAWLGARRESVLEPSIASALQEHLKLCSACRAFEQQQRQLNTLLVVTAPRVQTNVSTDTIMRAVQQQSCVLQQFEDIRQQQQTRMERLRPIGAASFALLIFTFSCIPLLLLAIMIVQTDLAMRALSLLTGVIDVFVILAQYLQAGLTVIARDNWLLSGIALVVVVMMGMWLRLMRPPQEA